MKLYSSYSTAMYDHSALQNVVQDLVLAIPHYLEVLNADTIVVQGKSGMSMAFATLATIDFPLMVVRKKGENSHGSTIEGTSEHIAKRILVLDDFVSSGSTIRMIDRQVKEMDSGMRIVGVLEWSHDVFSHSVKHHNFDVDFGTEAEHIGVGSIPRIPTGDLRIARHKLWTPESNTDEA